MAGSQPKDPNRPSAAPGTLCANRQAQHDCHIEETYQPGIALLDSEARAIRLDPVEERFV
jgi:tmRNA-binding protein